MPSPNQPVKPAPFDAAPPTAPGATAPDHAGSTQRSWIAVALAGLLLLGLIVFFWLPQQVQQSSGEGAGAEPAATGTPVPPATSAARPPVTPQPEVDSNGDEAPWEEARQAKLRSAAQAVLEPLLDLQFTLEEQGVNTWAAREFQAALETARTGDELYRKREFEAATEHYEKSLAALQALRDSLPRRLQDLLEQTNTAIEELDQARAFSALDTIALIDPASKEAAALKERAGLLPGLLELFSAAASAESAGDLASARDAMAAAMELDPAHERARSEWQRLVAALEEQQFQKAMSQGYVALANNQLAEARTAFRSAATLRPDSPEARVALEQAGTADTRARLTQLNSEGRRQEQREQWQAAVSTYDKALALDSNVLFATEGLARSRPRAQLDNQLRQVLSDPMRLSNPAVAAETATLLEQARAVSPGGAVLNAQIAQLQDTLDKANTPVSVLLRSDLQTEVTVYKVARLGRFQEHLLQLRPGTYTAVGSRIGYRDVRENFTIEPGAQAPVITIACTEPI